MAHQRIWRQAHKKLEETVNRIKSSIEDFSRDREDLERRIKKMRGEVRNAGSQDRQFLLSDLAFLLEDEARLESRIQGMGAGLSSPYFSKIVSDEAIYISKYLSDPDHNLVKYTSPIAVLRYKEVGQVGQVNGITHHIQEKQVMDIQEGTLRRLEHADGETTFVCEGSRFSFPLKQPGELPVSKASLATPLPEIAETPEAKKYVLGEIIAKMREEQDSIMRAPNQGITLLKGAAGSGKTNVAFHRIVYLISEHPGEFSQQAMAVFCYNVALKKYLSNMLIELNIPRVQVYSIDEWVYSILRKVTNIGWLNYDEDSRTKIAKTRKEILPVLDAFYNENKAQLNKTISTEEVGEDSLLRIDGLWILNLLYTYQPFLEHINWHDPDDPVRYNPGDRINHSDQYLLAWLIQKLAQDRNLNVFGFYDHVVVDEVQDLMPVQLALIDTLHNNSMTIVGDVSQRIFDLGVDSWDQFPVNINHTYELTMCHRSTLQTILFANELLADREDTMLSARVGKQGEKPCVFRAANRTDALGKVVSYVKAIKAREPMASVAVLSYRNRDLDWINRTLGQAGVDGYIASKSDWEFSPRVAVTTYHQVKGLEFDYVFILGLNDYQQLNVPNMDKVIYTVVTRAQKRVYIAYCHQLPDILKGVDQDLYLTH
jgi:DNA helicase IV